ncbi:MAG: HD domain-containing protein [Pyramidobacter sp.]|uniref:HD domain-containing protein n=1 Tax=Pyramidobacter sp. TaxID=1943581 RepID=UPI002A804DBF|nr:HD domain-containing protein [Pyramidobacter sp.]MDY4032103.1 HD domain-containing protein [Pyramidobacter sp.]
MDENEFAARVAALGGQLYVVGGWVRDRLIGRPAEDRDYVVCGLDAKTFERGFQVRSVGRQFPVYLLEVGGRLSEVALARTERKTGTGYRGFEARFSPDTTIEEDLYRRDTRMNSMAVRLPGGELIDPFGGRGDIENKIIRATSEHFRDDPVRALRAARQSAQLGFSIAPGTVELMTACRGELAREPGERIFAEMRRALASPQPELFFTALRDAGILDAVFPELAALIGVEQPVKYHRGLDAFEHSMEVLRRAAALTRTPQTRFAALVHDLGKGLTPREEWPHHIGHEARGLAALERFNGRMTLPRLWYRFARFIIANHMRLPRLRRPGAIVAVIGEMRRGGFDAAEVAAVIRADRGALPVFLQRYDRYAAVLDEERARLAFPADLPPSQRALWLNARLADALTRSFDPARGEER